MCAGQAQARISLHTQIHSPGDGCDLRGVQGSWDPGQSREALCSTGGLATGDEEMEFMSTDSLIMSSFCRF